MFTGWVLYSILCPPPNFLQRYDFKGLTPNDYMDMDLGPIFGQNSRFGVVWERFERFRTWVRSLSLNSLVYQRVTGGCGFSDLLEDSAPALPDSEHCRIG